MDTKVAMIFGGVLGVALVILSAVNVANISSVEGQMGKLGRGQKELKESGDDLKKKVSDLRDDVTLARTKIAKLETKSAEFEEMAESAARAAAKALLDGAREDIVAEAVRKSGEASGRTEVDALSKDVSSLRAAVAKLAEARPAQAAAAPRPRAQEPARRPRQNEDGAAAQGAAAGQNERNPQTQEQMAKARDEMRDLFQKRRSGDITDEEFRQKIQEMREKYPDLMRSGRGSRGGRQREDRNR